MTLDKIWCGPAATARPARVPLSNVPNRWSQRPCRRLRRLAHQGDREPLLDRLHQRALVRLKVREALVRSRVNLINSVRFLLKSLGVFVSASIKAMAFTRKTRAQLAPADALVGGGITYASSAP